MAFDGSDVETRVLAIERKVNRLFQVTDEMVLFRLPALEQSLAMAWTVGPRRQAQFVGEVDGCTSHAFPGAAVAVKDHASGVTLGTATCDANGKYEVWANLDSDPQNLDVVATPTGTFAARFAASATQNVSAAHAGGNGVATVVIPPASGFICGPTNYYPDAGFAWTFNIKGCRGTGIAGATISISAGSCVTGDGTGGTTLGQCTINPPAGTYTVTVTPPAGSGFATFTQSITFSAATTTNITLAADASHVCTSLCNFPIARTLFTSDGLGTITLTYTSGTTWTGAILVPVSVNVPFCVSGCVFSGNMTVTYTFNGTTLSKSWRYICCCAAGAQYATDPAGGLPVHAASVASSSASITCFPFSATCTVPIAFNAPAPDPQGFGCNTGSSDAGYQTPGGGGLHTVTP